MELKDRAAAFLRAKRIAVVGVSRSDRNSPANAIWRKLVDTGHTVYPVNSRATEIDGARCYSELGDIDGPVDAVVVVTPPAAALGVVQACSTLGINKVWMHRGLGPGSESADAVSFCRGNGIDVIAGACPMMFCEPVDFGHKCIRFYQRVRGTLPA